MSETYKMPSAFTLSKHGVDFIKQYEGFYKKAFWDYKQWSIGYGSKAKHKDEVITEPEAAKRLGQEASKFEVYIKKYIKVPLTQNMFDALVSFTYNVGQGWMINGSSVLTALNSRDYKETADNLLAWNRAGGKILKGLSSRRKAERALFLTDA